VEQYWESEGRVPLVEGKIPVVGWTSVIFWGAWGWESVLSLYDLSPAGTDEVYNLRVCQMVSLKHERSRCKRETGPPFQGLLERGGMQPGVWIQQ